MNRSNLARAIGLLFCVVQTSLLAEPSTVQIRESSKDRAVTLQTQGDAGTVSYLAPFATGQSTVTATLGLEGIDVASFDENTRFELVVGRHAITKRLGDDPRYRKGSTVATFTETTSSPASEEAPAATDSRRLQLRWSAKSLRATLALRSTDVEGAPWSLVWSSPMRAEEAGKTLSAVIAGHIAFGPQASSAFEIKATGKLGLKRIPQRTPDSAPVTLSSVSLSGSGKGDGRVPAVPSFTQIQENGLTTQNLPSSGGEVTVQSGVLEGAKVIVPAGVFPSGMQLAVSEVAYEVNRRGKIYQAKGLQLLGDAPSDAGGFIELELPNQISDSAIKIPYSVDAEGRFKPLEIVRADAVTGKITVRIRVAASGNLEQFSSPVQLRAEFDQPSQMAAGMNLGKDIKEIIIGVIEAFDGGLGELLDTGYDGWERDLYKKWFGSNEEEPLGGAPFGSWFTEPSPIERELSQPNRGYSVDLKEPVPVATVSNWTSAISAMRDQAGIMQSEERAGLKSLKSGFNPKIHGFSVASGPTKYFRDTSAGMALFAQWAYRFRYPLYSSFGYGSTIGTGQDILASRATATLRVNPVSPRVTLSGNINYSALLETISKGSEPVLLQASRVSSSGEFLGVRYLLGYGIAVAGASDFAPRVLVYDPSSPGQDNALVRFHPRYGMYYIFPDGVLGVDVRPVFDPEDPIREGAGETFIQLLKIAEAGRLDGVSDLRDFSIQQGDYVTREEEMVRFLIHNGGELPVRLLRFNSQEFDIPSFSFGTESGSFEGPLALRFSAGKNVIKISALGKIAGRSEPLHHPDMTANPREVHYLKMPLTVLKASGDGQVAPVGSLQLRNNLKVVVNDANGLPVPYPTLKWSIVDPVAYGGGALSVGSSSGGSLTVRYDSPKGEGWISWTLGSRREVAQNVKVEVVGVSRMDAMDNRLVAADLEIYATSPPIFKAYNGCPDETQVYRDWCVGYWNSPTYNQVFQLLADGGVRAWDAEGIEYNWSTWGGGRPTWTVLRYGCGDYRFSLNGFWNPIIPNVSKSIDMNSNRIYYSDSSGDHRNFTR